MTGITKPNERTGCGRNDWNHLKQMGRDRHDWNYQTKEKTKMWQIVQGMAYA